MAGVKGRSGRKTGFTMSDEALRMRVIRKSWQILEDDLNDPEVSKAVKRDIALKIAPKNIPTELTGDMTAHLVAMGTIEKNGSDLTFNIGVPANETDSPEDTGCSGEVTFSD